MKKAIMTILYVGLLAGSAFPFRMGLEFGVNSVPTIGLNLRVIDFLEVKPQLGFMFSDNYNSFTLGTDVNFYLPGIGDLQHYAGPGIGFNVNTNDADFGLNGHYGLRYDFNEVLSAFGEIGFTMDFDPFVLASSRAGVGLTVYFPNFQ